jgi:soluble lytic murein transglycosylase
MMSYIRTNDRREQMNGNLNAARKPVKNIQLSLRKNDRVEALLDLALSEEAVAEMMHLSKNASSMEDISYICSKLEELGEYKHLVRLAGKLPYREEFHRFLYPRAYWTTVDNLSGKYTIDPLLVLAIVREESRFDAEARSPAGALGLMQIMPQTASSLNTRLKLGMHSTRDILQVKNNLHAGIYYLGNLMKEFGSFAHAVAAYNAGEDMVKKWIQKGHYKSADEFIEDIPYAETRTYVKRVLTTFFEYKRASVPDGEILHIEREKL